MSERPRVLVTGATGLLGGTMMEHLKGEPVVGTTRNSETEIAKRLGLKQLNTENLEETLRFISDNLPEKIFHFAGMAKPKDAKDNPEKSRLANVDSTLNLLAAIKHARKKDPTYDPIVIVVGSVEQFGDPTSNGQIFDENSERKPVNTYGEQKEEMSKKFLELAKEYDIRGYVMIQGQSTGVSPSGEISQSGGFLIPEIASQIASLEESDIEPKIIKTGNISHKRDIVDINDAIKAYIALAKNTPEIGEYLVCSGSSIALSEILGFMTSASTKEIIHIIEKDRGFGEAMDRYYSHQHLTAATGWTPETPAQKSAIDVLDFKRRELQGDKVR